MEQVEEEKKLVRWWHNYCRLCAVKAGILQFMVSFFSYIVQKSEKINSSEEQSRPFIIIKSITLFHLLKYKSNRQLHFCECLHYRLKSRLPLQTSPHGNPFNTTTEPRLRQPALWWRTFWENKKRGQTWWCCWKISETACVISDK